MKKQLKWILIALGFFALSRGLWYNFQSLWLQQNGLSIKTISTVTSLASFGSVSLMIMMFNYITKDKIKIFVQILLSIKILILILLFLLNGTQLFIPIKILIFLDIVVDTEILTSIYPLLTLFKKDDKLYGQKVLIDSSFYDFGVMLGALFLGKTIFNFQISFNIFLFISILTSIITFIILNTVKLKKEPIEKEDNIFSSIIKYIKNDKISKLYLLYTFTVNTSFYIVTGLQMLLLTDSISMPASIAANYILIISIISDIVGFLILKKFTFKNNNINIFIKHGGRAIMCLMAFILNNKYAYIIALSYILLFSNSYSHVNDAPFINRLDNNYQLSFNNIKNIFTYAAQAIGIWICGLGIIYGIKYIFCIAGILSIVQTLLMMYTYKMYKDEVKN